MRDSNVEIIPNRRQIDDRFPVLGFTVKTGGLPFYEVLATTERRFFAPEFAGERSAANFFSSRQANNQLQRAGDDSVYILPAAVLNGFAQNTPKLTAVYYALIAYADENGGGGRFSHNPETLSNDAPFIDIEPNFTGQTIAKSIGLSLDQLRRVEAPSASSAFETSYHLAAGAVNTEDEDEGEGEDGYSMLNSRNIAAAMEDTEAGKIYPEDGYELNMQQDQSSRTYSETYSEGHEPSFNDSAYDDGYSDGFETELGEVERTFSSSQESIFPEGASEPDFLHDEDPAYYSEGESQSDWEDEFDYTGQSTVPDLDQSFEYAGAPDARSQNGFKTKNGFRTGNTDVGGKRMIEQEDEFNETDDTFDEDYGETDSNDRPYMRAADAPLPTEAEKKILSRKTVIETVARHESGSSKNPYQAINADKEFAKWSWHEAYGKYHIGLSYGIVQFTQDGGSLGKLLELMRGRDKTVFDTTFGGTKLADQLIKVTTAAGPMSRDVKSGRSARVQPVDGKDIWLSPWLERFETAAEHLPFQAAQNELANTEYLEKILDFCRLMGLDTDRAVAMVYDRAVQMGVGGARKWVADVVGPLQTAAVQQQALKALGKKDLKEFQTSAGLKADGGWGPMSHAAMVSALKTLGAKSPIPIPTRDQMMDAMVRAAAGKQWEDRVKELRKSKDLSDTNFPF
ncbi:MAG: hypothetical protein H7070_16040 [Saprospiraceae bacterium]|nr:hypothetical protein [Pyrinomonadaceae bacterium]